MRYLTLAIMSGGICALGQSPTSIAQHTAAPGEPSGVEAVHELGTVDFPTSCSQEAHAQFELGVAQLHHMMYQQARPHFDAAAEADPDCAMAHWGLAMTRFQPLWHPTSEEDLARGMEAVERALEIGAPTPREAGFIEAVQAFFADPEPPRASAAADHEARVRAWLAAQRELHEAHPDDVEAAAFLGLAEVAYAQTQFSPVEAPDVTRRREAGALLQTFLSNHPDHPGLFHYIIHAYDTPQLAPLAQEVAEGYDQVAPHTPHALHMPSHIFVRMGRWEETAEWNERSAEAALAQVDVDPDAIGHHVHALDYMMYAYLQLDEEARARRTLERARAVERAWPVFAFAYNLAAAQARFHLERQQWEDAAALEPQSPDVIDWERYPAAVALFHYARGLGAARSGDPDGAEAERDQIQRYVQALRDAGDEYWAHMTEALAQAVGAWILYERGDVDAALARMSEAADLEDSMDKHPITPGEVLPVRELYAEMLLRAGRAAEAREAYEASLARTPNRRNALAGVERATAEAGAAVR